MTAGLRLRLLSTLAVFVVLEALCAAFFFTFRDRFAFSDPYPYVLSEERVRGLAQNFDPVLGWRPRYPTPWGERPRTREEPPVWAAAFGDSYVHGDEVDPADTWAEALAAETGAGVLNLGVGGYGPDQALLRFRDEAARLPVRLVLLGFTPENINRVVNRYRPFYFADTGLPYPKPRFLLRGDTLELLPLPFGAGQGPEALTDPAFVDRLGRGDFWYERGDRLRWGFPFLRLALSPATWRQARAGGPVRSEMDASRVNLWRTEARELFLRILDTFVAEASASGRRPVLLLLSGPDQVRQARQGEGIAGRNPILDRCHERDHTCFDAIATLADEDASLEQLFMPGGHYSPDGHRRLARHLHAFLGERGLLP